MSGLLLDTHALLWWVTDDDAISPTARAAIADPTNAPYVSTVTLWELAIKQRLGKIDVPARLPQLIVEQGFLWLEVYPEHAWGVASLPDHHRDPFDRLIVSQAISEGLAIVSADRMLAGYGVEVVW